MKTTLLAIALGAAIGTAGAAPTFNLQFTPGTSLQAQQGFSAAAARWASLLTDDVTINLTVGFNPLGAGILGQAGSASTHYSYQTFRTALNADRSTLLDDIAVGSLPTGASFNTLLNRTANNPNGAGSATPYIDGNGSANNATIWISNAEAKALNLTPTAQTLSGCIGSCDGFIQFNSNFGFDFNQDDGIASDLYDFIGVAAHEIGHTLGFRSGVDILDFNSPPNGGPFNDNEFIYTSGLDLFRYSPLSAANAAIDWTADARAKYFSIDGGATLGPQFSTGVTFGDGRQASHWKDSLMIGLLDPTAALGELLLITNNDLDALDAIGWNALPIPEPSQYSMFGAALALLALVRGKKKYFHRNSK